MIESDASITSLLRTLFDREGFETVSLEHGREAMRVIESGECVKFDAIVVQCAPVASPADHELSMGIAFLSVLVDTHPACLAKTIVLTTMTREITNPVSRACRLLVEPFDIDELTAAVRDCAKS